MKAFSSSFSLLLAACALPALIGCATVSVSPERKATTQSAIRAAEELGAASRPNAALYLGLAKEELTEAERLVAADEPARAELQFQRAIADAELALTLTRLADAEVEAAKAKKAVGQLEGSAQ